MRGHTRHDPPSGRSLHEEAVRVAAVLVDAVEVPVRGREHHAPRKEDESKQAARDRGLLEPHPRRVDQQDRADRIRAICRLGRGVCGYQRKRSEDSASHPHVSKTARVYLPRPAAAKPSSGCATKYPVMYPKWPVCTHARMRSCANALSTYGAWRVRRSLSGSGCPCPWPKPRARHWDHACASRRRGSGSTCTRQGTPACIPGLCVGNRRSRVMSGHISQHPYGSLCCSPPAGTSLGSVFN